MSKNKHLNVICSILVITVLVCFCSLVSTVSVVFETYDVDYQLINGDTQVEIIGYHGSGDC